MFPKNHDNGKLRPPLLSWGGQWPQRWRSPFFHLSCRRQILKNLTFIYLMKMVASSLTFPPSSWPATVEHWFPYQLKVLLMIQQLQAPLSSPKERVSKSLSSLCALRTINSLWWFSCNELIFHILTIGIQTPAGSMIFNPGISRTRFCQLLWSLDFVLTGLAWKNPRISLKMFGSLAFQKSVHRA